MVGVTFDTGSIQASASTTPEIVKNVHTEDLEAASLKHEVLAIVNCS